MKNIKFTKMSGAGNDFIVMDPPRPLNIVHKAPKICHRTNGLGADGIVLCCPSKKADVRMRIINADGSEAEMCGNGVRCLAAYYFQKKSSARKLITIETLAGTILARKVGSAISVRLSDPKDYTANMNVPVNGQPLHLDFINTGVPHAVCFVSGLSTIDVNTIGRTIRYHTVFAPRGTNVNFVEEITPGLVKARTYERGVEAETQACGTGSVASAIAAYLKGHPGLKNTTKATMRVKTQSEEILHVRFDFVDRKITNVWLTGPARFIAEGNLFL